MKSTREKLCERKTLQLDSARALDAALGVEFLNVVDASLQAAGCPVRVARLRETCSGRSRGEVVALHFAPYPKS